MERSEVYIYGNQGNSGAKCVMQELPTVTELGPKTTFVWLVSLSAFLQRNDAFLALFHSPES